MSTYNVLKDNESMLKELERIFEQMKNGTPVPSHIWLIIQHPGIPEGQWVPENLEAFLEFFEMKDSPATAYTVWSNIPDKSPALGADEVIGDSKVLKGGTAINITDFILACTQDARIVSLYHDALMGLLAFPWRFVIAEKPDTLAFINNSVIGLIKNQASSLPFPHHDPVRQKNEYDRVFSALEQGDLIPSHWQLYLKFNGDVGGDIWDEERIMVCLQDMMEMDNNNDLKTVWTSDPMHVIEHIDHHQLRSETGEALDENRPNYLHSGTPINLADFIWLCCKQEKIINSPLVIIVTIIALFPFRHAVGDDKDTWVNETHTRLKRIHRATKRSITH